MNQSVSTSIDPHLMYQRHLTHSIRRSTFHICLSAKNKKTSKRQIKISHKKFPLSHDNTRYFCESHNLAKICVHTFRDFSNEVSTRAVYVTPTDKITNKRVTRGLKYQGRPMINVHVIKLHTACVFLC